ncbi:hypothetical protein E2C01_052781 [Portunus trituberculatus]|uniref:Uncharacterized protein n=1 Tax=Portunus trituberculatus TaxID=210409 RepID=A0A5B7GIK9_PORTR|nr:hypothetical protein [Portunus trituberculatus]
MEDEARNGLLSSVLEVRGYLREKRPDVMWIVETKLKEEVHVSFKEETEREKGEESPNNDS